MFDSLTKYKFHSLRLWLNDHKKQISTSIKISPSDLDWTNPQHRMKRAKILPTWRMCKICAILPDGTAQPSGDTKKNE